MSLNKESTGYTIGFLVVMTLVVGISLALVSSSLEGMIDTNQIVDKKKQILRCVAAEFAPSAEEEAKIMTPDFVLTHYEENITEFAVDHEGKPVPEEAMMEKGQQITPFDIDFKKEIRKPVEERRYPVYQYDGEEGSYYIIPLFGLGLWDDIWGYMAVKSDFNTIAGAAFDHAGETPGLGAKMTEYWFRKQFEGQNIYQEEEYKLTVMKGENNVKAQDSQPGGEYKVDGMSGATITTEGVDKMLEKCIGFYEPFFEKKNSSEYEYASR